MTRKLWHALARRRVEEEETSESGMARVMGIFDLTALGVGATLGLGVYVLAAKVAKQDAGPAVCISFAIAALASALAGMCYAEFASRVPKSGSAYIYSYTTVGEFIAFIIGWNLVFEYLIGTASVATGFSSYVNSLTNNATSNFFSKLTYTDNSLEFLKMPPDFFAFGVIGILTTLLGIGVQESTSANKIFGTVNLLTIILVIVAGAINANPKKYWNIPKEDIPEQFQGGEGGFMPFGISGILVGAAKSFFGFVGFDSIASCGEEAKNPKKSIPLAIMIALFIVTFVYLSLGIVLTMMFPYYDQNPDSAFPYVFEQIGWKEVAFLINAGGTAAFLTSLIGAMFPLPRIIYSMSSDGLIFKCFANIHEKTQTPILATIVSGLVIGLLALFVKLDWLLDLAAIGTLLPYTIVAMSILMLRYQATIDENSSSCSESSGNSSSLFSVFSQIFNLQNQKYPTKFSSRVASWGILFFAIMSSIFALIRNYLEFFNEDKHTVLCYVGLSFTGFILLLCVVAIGRQPTVELDLAFKVPLVPMVPCCSVLINIILMLQLPAVTWALFAAWIALGLCIYFFYGIRNSKQGLKDHQLGQKIFQLEKVQ